MSRQALSVRLCLFGVVLLVLVSSADAEEAPLRDLTEADIAAWSQLYGDPLLSPDGKWLVYLWSAYDDSSGTPRNGMPQLIVRATDSDLERRYSLGEFVGAKRVKMSDSGRWIGYTRRGVATDRAVVAVMNLESGASRDLSEGENFEFSAHGDRIIVRGQRESDQRSESDQRTEEGRGPAAFAPADRYELSVHELGVGEQKKDMRWRGVQEHALDAHGRYLAFIDESGLHLLILSSKHERTWRNEPDATYSTLRWSPSGRSLALLRAEKGRHSVVLVDEIGHGAENRRVFDLSLLEDFPRGFDIAMQARSVSQLGPLKNDVLRWRDEEDGLFFNIRSSGADVDEPASAPKVADLVLWHGRDPWIPTEKASGMPERYLSFLSLPEGRFERLADETLGTVLPQGRGSYALGFTWRPYGIPNAICPSNFWGGPERRDYALVNLKTGERRSLENMRGLEVTCHLYWPGVNGAFAEGHAAPEPQLSPNGEALVYLDASGDYQVYDVESGAQRNVTRGIAGWPSQDRHGDPGQYVLSMSVPTLQGWTADGRHVLVSDGFDVWSLPIKAGLGRNLTGNGRRERIVYAFADLFARGAPGNHSIGEAELSASTVGIDLSRPIYFAATDLETFHTGLAVWNPGQQHARMLASEDGAALYFKARRAPVYLARLRRAAPEGLNFYRLDDHWNRSRQLTDLSPQLKRFRWPKTQLLTFKSPRGEVWRATLYVPAGSGPRGGHPTIVSVYQRYGVGDIRNASDPRTDTELFRWLRHGYAVLKPDIPQKLADPGVNALERVTGAIEAAVATGLVDRERLGLYGHSYGGYETFFMVTQTDLFKAAVPVAGVSSLQSFYNNLTASRPGYPAWLGSSWIENNGQSYIGAPWWEEREAYQRNSPIEHAMNVRTPLLIAHGDADAQVPFNQSMEMFTVLRRLQRPVMLLQYVGADHSVDSHPDLLERELQFFGHFLKGAPAPAWWTNDVSYYKGQVPQPAMMRNGQ